MQVNNLTQEVIDNIFSIYKEVTNRHGNSPKLEEIEEKFSKGFSFEVSSGEFKWSSKIVFKKEEDNISIEFIYNQKLPSFMLQSLKLMKEQFEEKIKKIT